MSSLNNKILNTERVFIESGENKGYIKIDGDKVVTCDWDILGSLKIGRDSNLHLNIPAFYPVGNYVNITSIEAGDPLTAKGSMPYDDYIVGYIFERSLFEEKRWYIIQVKTTDIAEITVNFLFQLEADYSTGKRECYPLNNTYIEDTSTWVNFQMIAEPRNSSSADINLGLNNCVNIGFYCKMLMETNMPGINTIGLNSVCPISSMTIKPLPLFLDIDGYAELHNIS